MKYDEGAAHPVSPAPTSLPILVGQREQGGMWQTSRARHTPIDRSRPNMETSVNAQIHRLIEVAHQRQLAQIAALSEAERDDVGTPERWSAKDHLAHTMY